MENSEQPVYPHNVKTTKDNNITFLQCNGLTKREYFAGLAMQGLLAAKYEYLKGNADIPADGMIEHYAVQMADELLKQLKE